MGLPNWTRVLAYSTAISSAFCAVPTISVDSTAVATSSVRLSTGHPALGLPITSAAGTLSNFTWHIRRVISTVLSCVTVTPFSLTGTHSSVIPSSPEPLPVRAATTIASATCASGTKNFSPVSVYPEPFLTAFSAIPPASQRPAASATATVAINLPAAILPRNSFFCASDPPSRKIGPPNATVVNNGPGTSALPASSAITVRSRKVPPCPPNSSGTNSPGHPRPTSLSQKAAS